MIRASRERLREIDEIFDAALDLPPNERDLFITDACRHDPELLPHVRALLAAYGRSGDFLESPALAVAAPLLGDAPFTASVPERAGPFRIVRELGAGGMGVVYLAEREGAEFTQRVALKLVRHLGASEAVRKRFMEERRILALLDHPRIAHLIDGGLTPEGLPYFAMELVDGEPIDAYCNSRTLSIDQRIDLFIDVCDAVQYAHEHFVIHRDLKPSNILVRKDGQLKLLDFGIAKLLDPLRGPDGDATQTGLIALTPEYAAPEQIRGEAATSATDTYALGVLLFVLLAGRRPYDVRGKSPAELERIVGEVEPPRPSAVAAEGVRRVLHGDLDQIVLKALHKDPVRRYSSAAALRDDLRRYRTGLPVLARPDSRVYRLRKFVRRNGAVVSALGVTALALITATAFSASQMREAQRQRDEAVREAERQRALTEVQSVLGSDLRDATGKVLPAPARIALAEQVLTQQFRAKPWLVVEGMLELSGRLYEMGERDADRALSARAIELARRANLPTQLALGECHRAYSWAYDDQVDSARAALTTATALLAQPNVAAELVSAFCMNAEGQVLVAEGKPDEAIPVFERAVELTERAQENGLRLPLLIDLSSALRAVGRTREAAEYQRLVVMDREAAGFGGTLVLPSILGYLTASLYELGEVAAVDSIARTAYAAEMRLPGGRSSSFVTFSIGLAGLRLGQLDTAEVWIMRALRDTTEDAGGLSAYIPPAITQLRIEQGRIAEARRSLSDLPSGTLIRRVNRAWFTARVRHADGDVRGAMTMLEDSLRTIAGSAPKPPPALAMPIVTAAEWRLAAGDAQAADSLATLARTAAAVDSLALQRSGYVGRAELVRAQARKALGDASAAQSAADRAIVALASGYGPAHRYVTDARAFRATLITR